jgi:hypothetical protein
LLNPILDYREDFNNVIKNDDDDYYDNDQYESSNTNSNDESNSTSSYENENTQSMDNNATRYDMSSPVTDNYVTNSTIAENLYPSQNETTSLTITESDATGNHKFSTF